ncbi:MAG: radical SAM protein [Candidatus Latescibacteria bacterium]|jgi:MoaA/NifB/PqqE/SkfB family radical SAM enzyme|nr:radical SAM protein [Candidatus Latescibacterota bacterium]
MINPLISVRKIIKHYTFIKKPLLIRRIIKGYFNTHIMRRDTLRSIELAVTYKCQAQCHKCYSKNLIDKNRSYLTIDQIRDIIDQAMKLGLIHVNITGGEPTLRKDIIEIVKACHPNEIMVSLVTNAYVMTREKMKQLKEAGLNTIQISLDSSVSDIHNKLRGLNGIYDKVMATASWAREFDINLCFTTVLSTETSSNKNEMLKLLELSEREKAFLLVCDSAAIGGWEGQKEKMFTCEERNKALEELMKHPLARHHSMYNFRGRAGCPAGVEKLYITAYGEVTPCDLIHDSFGNVLKEDIETIWKRMCSHPLYSLKAYDCVRYLDEFKHRHEM